MPEKTKYPQPCGCAGPKYISQCAVHQAIAHEQHAEALTGSQLRAENERLRKELDEARAAK